MSTSPLSSPSKPAVPISSPSPTEAPKNPLQSAKSLYSFFNFCLKNSNVNPYCVPLMRKQIEQIVDLRLDRQNLPKNAFADAGFPSHIKSPEDLLDELTTKVEEATIKSLDRVPYEKPIEFLNDTAGITREGNNCWVTAFIFGCLLKDLFRKAVEEVGRYYKEGNLLDHTHVESVKKYFKTGYSVEEASLKEIVATHCKIREPILQLHVIHFLMTNGIPADITFRFICPLKYKPLIIENTSHLAESLQGPVSPEKVKELIPGAMEMILKDPSIGYEATLRKRKEDGAALLEIFEAYDAAVKEKRAVPKEVGQKVRVALHHIIKSEDSLSEDPYSMEDVYEALSLIVGHWDFIRQAKGEPLPPEYFPVETRRFYKEDGDPQGNKLAHPDATPLVRDDRGHLFSSTVTYDHQILLDMTGKDGLTLEYLLMSASVCSDTGEGEYPVSETDRRAQKYSCNLVQTFIQTVPKELTIGLKRFKGIDGHFDKDSTQVIANEVFTTPLIMTGAAKPVAYELKGFIVHRNNHYITYKLSSANEWIEIDDHRLRRVENEELTQLLHGKKSLSTPYLFFYTLVPQEEQNAMLQRSARLRKERSGEDWTLQHYSKTQEGLSLLEKFRDALKKGEAYGEIIHQIAVQFPETLRTLYQLIDIETEKPLDSIASIEKFLSAHPEKLKDTTRQWIYKFKFFRLAQKSKQRESNSRRKLIFDPFEGNSVEQLIEIEKQKLHPLEMTLFRSQLLHFVTLLYSTCNDPETFQNLWNNLPTQIKDDLKKLLLVTEDGRIAFESALKAETLQAFILETIDAYPERSPMLLDKTYEIDEISAHFDFISARFCSFLKMYENSQFTDKQLVKLCDILLPQETKDDLFLEICQRQGINPASAQKGRELFEKHPRIFATREWGPVNNFRLKAKAF